MTRARILIAENHEGMREQVKGLLLRQHEVLGALGDGEALVTAALEMKPDVCVLDISMPLLGGIEAAKRLKTEGSLSKVIFLTMHEDRDFLQAALSAGAKGYVIKRRLGSDLTRAVERVLAGRVFISAPLRRERKEIFRILSI